MILCSFLDETIAFKPDLIVVSGFHLLDSQNESFWQNRITDAEYAFMRLPHSVPVHLELASMSHCPVMVAIVTQLFPLVNSIGLNEQELAFISKCLGGIHADITGLNGEDEIGKTAFTLSFTSKYSFKGTVSLPEQCDFMSSQHITIMYFDRYVSCFRTKIQIILITLCKSKIQY